MVERAAKRLKTLWLKDLRKLGNIRRISKLHRIIAQRLIAPPPKMKILPAPAKIPRKIEILPAVRYPTRKPEPLPNTPRATAAPRYLWWIRFARKQKNCQIIIMRKRTAINQQDWLKWCFYLRDLKLELKDGAVRYWSNSGFSVRCLFFAGDFS